MNLFFSKNFVLQYKLWFKSQKNVANKIKELIASIKINPYEGIGKPERLKSENINLWSRRITKKDRLVYSVQSPKTFTTGCNTFFYCAPTDDDKVILISCKGHYDEK